jgi:3D (Asp-Asp-Asp) domain-containing protein
MQTVRSILKRAHIKANLAIILAVIFVIVLLVGSFFFAKFVIRIENERGTISPTDYLERPLEIEITTRYRLSVQMGMIVTKYSDMNLTCYTNRIEETDSTPHHTASGRIVYEGSCAVSQDIYGPVISKDKKKRIGIWPGDLIYVVAVNKWLVVEDTMNKRHKRHIDLFMYVKDLKKAQKFGWKKSDIFVIRLRK